MSSSRRSAWTLPLVILTATVATMITTAVVSATRKKQPLSTRPEKGKLVVSHLTVKCRDLEKSLQFYLAVGFMKVSRTNDAILLSLPAGLDFSPFLLLQKLPEGDDVTLLGYRADCTTAGYGRMALQVPSIIRSSNHLKRTLGLEPIAKPVTDRSTDQNGNPLRTLTVAAWKDPDGTVVELVESIDHSMGATLHLMHSLGLFHYPRWIHCNVNVTNFNASVKAYRQLGFTITSDHSRVKNKLYKALAIPDPGMARHVAMMQRDQDLLQVDVIEWEDPKTTRGPNNVAGLCSFALTTPGSEMGRVPVGWDAQGQVENVVLPEPLGVAKTRTLLDPDGTAVELIDYI
jgi:catechol 2,3-dioxygenase-like lactoylglutathione lyase family enzyme